MRILILSIGLIFCFFPYTQILPSDSYNQPYAFAFCAVGALLSFNMLAREFPRTDLQLLFALAALGLILFVVTCLPNPDSADLKSLLSFLSPAVFCLAGFAIARSGPDLSERIAWSSACVWLGVAVIQTFIAPDFAAQFVGQWEDAAAVVVESGRGVVGLAPEPTHHGFHLLVMAAALAVLGKGRTGLAIACLASAFLLARSSSALLAFIVGSLLYAVIYMRLGRILLVAIIPIYYGLGALLASDLLPDTVRLVQLLKLAYENPMLLVLADSSANARIGGAFAGLQEILDNLFIPFGMSNESWVLHRETILAQNSWLMSLSSAGVPSGLLIIVYQAGIFGLILLGTMLIRMLSATHTKVDAWLICILCVVFLSQYTLSTPGFGLVYGFILAREVGRRTNRPPEQAVTPMSSTVLGGHLQWPSG